MIQVLLALHLKGRREEDRAEPGAPLFTFDGRHCVNQCGVSETFSRLAASLAFPVPGVTTAPRLHCLRHSGPPVRPARPFSGWKIDRSPVHTTVALDRWWTPSGRALISLGGGFLVAAP